MLIYYMHVYFTVRKACHIAHNRLDSVTVAGSYSQKSSFMPGVDSF